MQPSWQRSVQIVELPVVVVAVAAAVVAVVAVVVAGVVSAVVLVVASVELPELLGIVLEYFGSVVEVHYWQGFVEEQRSVDSLLHFVVDWLLNN